MNSRIGFGFDVHRFSDDPNVSLFLGGIEIPNAPGLHGHSDADVICHAITDAILGAAGLGDIGEHFSDSDPRWSGARSITFVEGALQMAKNDGWKIVNVDCSVVLEQPKIAPHRAQIQDYMHDILGAPVSVKAKRAEGLGSIGRMEGVACWAVVLLAQDEPGGAERQY